eukprot:CAMPEP_0176400686 /NCGR_PEP_ID=MMETSP0126-20121128/47807_1 /TAXON_ID=141414 ORGANISM="Strombidinopsis acuminatum, Strain SPMC142" /NCGR_SAMPLE_ID=MMETSP0126 /ASSEMBLY_ACC=CAM_ASM_000229 /LENGTH=166 /DNA_ID=CAMNT_0017777113 /DNA_START=196 /DNA_END=696 /DNA_ORIENTATION=+
MSALSAACKYGHVPAVAYLLSLIENSSRKQELKNIINKPDALGYSPLYYACLQCAESKEKMDQAFTNRPIIIKKLIQAGANVNVFCKKTHMTALHWLAFNGDENSIHLLLRAGKIFSDKTGKEASMDNRVNHMVRDNQNLFAIDYAGWFDKTEALDEFLYSVPTKR